jgi:hypothetical protein
VAVLLVLVGRVTLTLALLVATEACSRGYGTRRLTRGENPPSEANQQYAEELMAARDELLRRAVALDCDDAKGARACGLILDEVRRPKRVRKFLRKRCGLDPAEVTEDNFPEECSRLFLEMVVSRWLERYTMVSAEELERHMKGYWEDDWRDWELWLLGEHNTRLAQQLEQRQREAKKEARAIAMGERAEQDADKRAAAVVDAVYSVGRAISGRAICPSCWAD